MISSLAKSIALASLFVSPTSLAFTTSSHGAARCSPLHASAAEDNSQRRPSLASSPQQEQQLNNDKTFDLPPRSSDNAKQSADDTLSQVGNTPRSSEFHNLETLEPTTTRQMRLDSERRSNSIYTSSGSDAYWELQDEISQLEQDLQSALDVDVSDSAVDSIMSMLRRAQSKDPEHVYKVTSGAARSAERMGSVEETEKYKEESLKARKMLPQFNLEGLWVGKYGSHGFEMINVTYSGDELIAYKVTGDKNIPLGEISFTANLSPNHINDIPGEQQQSKLDPILLSESSAKKWGTKRLPRFPGQGHAAEPGYINHQFMEGQLVVIGGGDYFSFAWVPLEHQIFFGRPSPELTLKMLREGGGCALTAGVGLDVPSLDASVKEQTHYVSRCLEVTSDISWDEKEEGKVDPFSCIWHGDEAEHCYFE